MPEPRPHSRSAGRIAGSISKKEQIGGDSRNAHHPVLEYSTAVPPYLESMGSEAQWNNKLCQVDKIKGQMNFCLVDGSCRDFNRIAQGS